MKVGDEFILQERSGASHHYRTFNIPSEDFGRRMRIVALPTGHYEYRAEFLDGECSYGNYGVKKWYVYEDMMQPVRGPW